MNTVTIPRKMANQDDLVVVPRKQYEELLALRSAKSFVPTIAQKKALASAERNLKNKKTLSFHELTRALGIAN
jgi:hypothetical protein